MLKKSCFKCFDIWICYTSNDCLQHLHVYFFHIFNIYQNISIRIAGNEQKRVADNFAFNIESKAKLKHARLRKLIILMRSIINLQFRSFFKKILWNCCKLLLIERKCYRVSKEAENLWKLQTHRFLDNSTHFLKAQSFLLKTLLQFHKRFLKKIWTSNAILYIHVDSDSALIRL